MEARTLPLARKVVGIVPYDSVRAWRSWSGHRADVARFEAAERRLGLRKTVQRAMVLGRLYGGGAILIGDGEEDVAKLARPLDPRLPWGGLRSLHAVSRWQLGVSEIDLNPLSPWYGEPKSYTLSAPGVSPLELHPSRVVRFIGNPLPDPSLADALWSDSVLQSIDDAVHAAALSLAGAASLLHEAKVDVVTVPNLSEHLSSDETTEQLSARVASAAAMKSINDLLLLGGGESWSRQTVRYRRSSGDGPRPPAPPQASRISARGRVHTTFSSASGSTSRTVSSPSRCAWVWTMALALSIASMRL